MATLALKAINYGADKIPDKAFHAVPGGFFRPEGEENPLKAKKKREKKDKKRQERRDKDKESHEGSHEGQKRESHHGQDGQDGRRHERSPSPSSESDSDSDLSEEEKKTEYVPPKRRNRRYQRRSDLDRGYESDQGATPEAYQAPRAGPPPMDYFPPPPRRAVDEPHDPEPYNPSKYDASPGQRDQYFAGHPKDSVYNPPPPAQYGLLPPENSQQSSSADRYRPANYPPSQTMEQPAGYAASPQQYQPYQQAYAPGPYHPYAVAPAVQPAQPMYNPNHATQIAVAPVPAGSPEIGGYQPPIASPSPPPQEHRSRHHRDRSDGLRRDDRSDSHRRDDSRRSHHDKSRKRSGSRRDAIRDKLDQNRDVGASALGAFAGGIIGNQFGKGKLSTIVGAALGGVGGNMAEKKYEERRKSKPRHSSRRYYEDNGYDSY